jgi:hypothetical protein
MPNSCDNALAVRGDRAAVEGFLRDVWGVEGGEGTALDFNAILPYPEKFRRHDEVADAWDVDWRRRGSPEAEHEARPRGGYTSGGREWCCANWGTKWNAMVYRVGEYKRRAVRIEFFTAWDPPRPWVLAASREYPELSFTLSYWESGCEIVPIVVENRAGSSRTLSHHSVLASSPLLPDKGF